MILLDQLLQQRQTGKPPDEQIQWLVDLVKWLRRNKEVTTPTDIPIELGLSIRLKFLLKRLNSNPDYKKNFKENTSSILTQIITTQLFTDVGLPSQSSFIQDLLRRIEDKFLPTSPITEDLSVLFFELFPDELDILTIDLISDNLISELVDLFIDDHNLAEHFKNQIILSTISLSSQIVSLSFNIYRELNKDIDKLYDFPEIHLQKIFLTLQSNQFWPDSYPEIEKLLVACEERRQRFYQDIDTRGIKVDLIYALENQRRKIERLSIILKLVYFRRFNYLPIRNFLSKLIIDLHHQRNLISFFSENFSLLTKSIIQRNSDVGEHYTAFSRTDISKMFQSSVVGGALISVTVFLKFAISSLAIKGFIKGFLEGLNYSGSFLLIQFLGGTIATKQPSATAPYLTKCLEKSIKEARISVLAIFRAQVIAVFGNLMLVFPICFTISLLALHLNNPVISKETALKAFYAPDLLGPSPLFAVFTGFLLFLSSLIAGWFANWVVVQKLPQRIKYNNRILSILGKQQTKKFAETVEHKSNILAANISLGFLLGLMPQYLQFFALPIEVRHVTLSAGSYAAALPIVLQSPISIYDFLSTSTGIFTIGVINISISFGFALFLAAISSRVKISTLWKITKWGLKMLLTKPSKITDDLKNQ